MWNSCGCTAARAFLKTAALGATARGRPMAFCIRCLLVAGAWHYPKKYAPPHNQLVRHTAQPKRSTYSHQEEGASQ
jgi:hypothetical protein